MEAHTPAGGVSPSPKTQFRTTKSAVKAKPRLAPSPINPSDYGVEIGGQAAFATFDWPHRVLQACHPPRSLADGTECATDRNILPCVLLKLV